MLNEATNILFRVTKRSTRFHWEPIPHLIWHHHIKVYQNLSDLFQGTHSLEPSIAIKLKKASSTVTSTETYCFSRLVNVVPPQAAAAKVTVLYVAVHLNLRSPMLAGRTVYGQNFTCSSTCLFHDVCERNFRTSFDNFSCIVACCL